MISEYYEDQSLFPCILKIAPIVHRKEVELSTDRGQAPTSEPTARGHVASRDGPTHRGLHRSTPRVQTLCT